MVVPTKPKPVIIRTNPYLYWSGIVLLSSAVVFLLYLATNGSLFSEGNEVTAIVLANIGILGSILFISSKTYDAPEFAEEYIIRAVSDASSTKVDIVDLYYLNEDQIRTLINGDTIPHFLMFCMILPDDVYNKILPCFPVQARADMMWRKNHLEGPVAMDELAKSETVIVELIRKRYLREVIEGRNSES